MANHIYLAGDSTVQTYGDSTNQGAGAVSRLASAGAYSSNQ